MPFPVTLPAIHHISSYSTHTSQHTTKTIQQALLFKLNNIRHSSVRGKSTNLISLDISSAFDTIDHHLLLGRLRIMFGVPGPALNWHRSYHTDRTRSSRGMTCPYPCCSKQACLRVQFLHRFSLRPSFHQSTALPQSSGSINNNMLTTPNCTWKFHLTIRSRSH